MSKPRTRARGIAFATVLSVATAGLPSFVGAQYFGRNKVQYDNFDFRILDAPHFDIYFYPAESLATADAARMAERWYARHAATLGHSFNTKPLIFYANHPDFQQTNIIGGFIDQGTGGVTESARDRVIMPFTGVYADNDHVLGHELVHVFQYDIAANSNAMAGMAQLPLWLIEGMAEYLSIGRNDPHTAMWLRDAALRNDLPTIRQLTTDPRYFPYRYGQALWAYIGGRWGDDAIPTLYRAAIRQGFERAIQQVLGVTTDTLSAQWLRAIREAYQPAIAGRTPPGGVGQRVVGRGGRDGDMDLSPALSPDGRYMAFFTRRGLFGIDLYVADAANGRIVKKLTGPNRDPHFDALSFINSAGSWSPDGEKFAFVVQAQGDNEIAILDIPSGDIERRVRVRGVGEMTDPAWGPDGRIAFSGNAGGISDLYVLDLASERVTQLTSDRNADLQPSWSPDGRTIAFVTDRGQGTDFEALTYAPMRIALLDVATGQTRQLQPVGDGKHINPQWAPDGRALYFIAERGGFSDIYRSAPDGSDVRQVTRLATGVSGITALSPALSVAGRSGRLAFSVFERAGYTIYRLDADSAAGTPVAAQPSRELAGALPPPTPSGRQLVTAYLAEPRAGLPLEQSYPISAYRPRLGLEYLGTPGVGVGFGPSGAIAGGGVAAYFTDMLNNHVLGSSLSVAGELSNTGGELFYLSQRRRWNWLLSASHQPLIGGQAFVSDTAVQIGGSQVPAVIFEQVRQRLFLEQGTVGVQYPFSQTRRVEVNASYTHISYKFDAVRLLAINGQVVDRNEEDLGAPPGLGYVQTAAALVGDYSFFGFTSPLAGGRYRFEVAPTFGQLRFQTVLADYRRYFFIQPVTLAFRGLGYARLGRDAEGTRLRPLFLGQPTLIRGYDSESFDGSECVQALNTSTCPVFDRLIGSRIGVANIEVRIPLLGTNELGLINFPYLPTEIAPFVDAGVAWTSDQSPTWKVRRESADRIPVFSAGVSARVNLFGYLVTEFFYAYPFQRPGKGAQFGFQIQPGW